MIRSGSFAICRCACGGTIIATVPGERRALQRHQATYGHQRWWRNAGWD